MKKTHKITFIAASLITLMVFVPLTSTFFLNQNFIKTAEADLNYSIIMNKETTNNWSFINSGVSFYTFRNTQFEFASASRVDDKLNLNANSGSIYNTTQNNINNFALTGLISIKVIYESNSDFLMYFGNQENPNMSYITLSNNTLIDLDNYSQYKYVSFKATNSDVLIDEIILNYSCLSSVNPNPLTNINYEIINTSLKQNDIFNPSLDLKVEATYNNNTVKTINYDQSGVNGYKFVSFKNASNVETDLLEPLNEGIYNFTISYVDKSVLKTIDGSFNVENSLSIEKQKVIYTYKDYIENSFYNTPALPSQGEQKILVVPVWLTDSNDYISASQKNTIKSDIEKAYFGTSSAPDMKWHSVKSYYEENSYNKLTINGVVTDWYESSYSSSINGDQTVELVKEVANWYKNEVGLEEYKTFDQDKDGYLDAIILIYGVPNSINSNDNLWAYCFWVQDYNLDINNPIPNTFFWASYDFMYENDHISGNRVDAHTYIHEMGHVLGLSDYYDYGNYNTPAARFSMQDYNVGSHDPFSKLALGWIDPYVVNTDSTMKITIDSFQESGDIIVLSNDYINSPFDEYFILELYTPTGLNEFDTTYSYSQNYPKGPTEAGIRLWHVDARLLGLYYYEDTYNPDNSGYYYDSSAYYNSFTNDGMVFYQMAMSNTTRGYNADDYASILQKDSDYDLLSVVRNRRANDYDMKKMLSNDALFKQGDTFSMSSYSQTFPKGTLLNSGESLGYSFEIISLDMQSATIEFSVI